MQRIMEQHPTPAALADRTVAFAQKHFPHTTIWVEPCCGSGALLSRLPAPRLGIEVDAAVAADEARCADCMTLTPADIGHARDTVCVVTNPPFNATAAQPGSNRIAARTPWLPQFLTHMATLAATGVFILPAGATVKRWWYATVNAQPDIVVALEYLGRVQFQNAAPGGVDVILVALRLPPAWASSWMPKAHVAALEAELAADMQIVLGGDANANAMVLIWSSPRKLGEFSTNIVEVRRQQASIRLEKNKNRRQGSSHVFWRLHNEDRAVRRLQHMRDIISARYRPLSLSSACISISELVELCASYKSS